MTMFESFKDAWEKIQHDPPGERFCRQYHRRQKARQHILNRILFIGVGLVCMVFGILMLFTPGPGIFLLFLGWGLIAQESLWLAKQLDKLELILRRWADWGEKQWKKSPTLLKIVIIAGTMLISAGALYVAYRLFLI